MPISVGSINQNDFRVKSRDISYEAKNVSINGLDEKTLDVELGNVLALNFGYDFVINSQTLSSTEGKKLKDDKASKEFVAKKENIVQNGLFKILKAQVDEEQKSVTVLFSKPIMSDVRKDMFDISYYKYSEPLEINATKGEIESVNIISSKPLISYENNKTRYQLKIKKQSFFSLDGGRTLGTTFEKHFKILGYPRISTNLSGKRININFSIPMDLNQSQVSVQDNGGEGNVSLRGSRKDYALISHKDYNGTILTIKSGVMSSDGTWKLSDDYVRDFNNTH